MTGSVLILGAGGLIGTALRAHLAPRYRLLSVDVRDDVGRVPGADEELFVVDLGDARDLDRLFERLAPEAERIAAVVHLAAYYDFANRDDPRYHRLEQQLPRLLEGLDAHVPATAPLLFAGSMASLAPTEPGVPLGPDAERHGGWAYPRHKLACEAALDASDTERSVVQLVLAAVYTDAGELVPLYQQIARVARRSFEAMFYPARVDRGLSYVHLDDVTDAFEKTMQRFAGTRRERERLMVSEDAPVTYDEIHRRTSLAFFDRVLPLVRVPRFVAWLGSLVLLGLARLTGRRRFVRPWMVRYAGEHFELDTSRTRALLDWQPEHRLGRDLDRILETARRDPERFHERNERRPW